MICVIGNVGVGKSKLLQMLSEKYGQKVICLPEPVEQWRSDGVLERLYSEPVKYAGICQVHIMNTLVERAQTPLPSETRVKIFEQSLECGVKIFTRALFNLRYITSFESGVIEKLYSVLCQLRNDLGMEKVTNVYLKCPPEVALERIKLRDRIEENAIGIDYLKLLNNLFDEFAHENCANTYVVDANRPSKDVLNEVSQIVEMYM